MRTFHHPVSIPSPDGTHALEYYDTIVMDGPVFGSVRLLPENWRIAPRQFGGPPLWSEDGRYVALPEAHPAADSDPEKRVWLMITVLDLEKRKEATYNEGYYNEIHLDSFHDGVIAGTANHIQESCALSIALQDLSWHPFRAGPRPIFSAVESWNDFLLLLLVPEALLFLPLVLGCIRLLKR